MLYAMYQIRAGISEPISFRATLRDAKDDAARHSRECGDTEPLEWKEHPVHPLHYAGPYRICAVDEDRALHWSSSQASVQNLSKQ